eukprot:TRINITY_DN14662_c0_g1_i1.p1 TRINITY_DN14662_c0_g1~~TRINITY_DN14662_c0_g1_i1.p1  ORF type:complete len:285 (-),score=81.91 TRINITY_DN14662_c0_g1_i1:287-1141(-)
MGCGASLSKDDAPNAATVEAYQDEATSPPASGADRQSGSYRARKQGTDISVSTAVPGSASSSTTAGSNSRGGSDDCLPGQLTSPKAMATPSSLQAADVDAAPDACIRLQKAREMLEAYNSFFEHIGIRKGWRTPPFSKEEVQIPFWAASEVVVNVRQWLDENSDGMVLRQLEGSSMNFLWGWAPGKCPVGSQAVFEEFFRGLVEATLSDGHGLVEGLDKATVDYYVSCHSLLANPGQLSFPERGASEEACTVAVAEAIPAEPKAPPAVSTTDLVVRPAGSGASA